MARFCFCRVCTRVWSCLLYLKKLEVGALCVYVGVTATFFFVDKIIRWTVVVRDTEDWMDTLVVVFFVLSDVHAVSKFVDEGEG